MATAKKVLSRPDDLCLTTVHGCMVARSGRCLNCAGRSKVSFVLLVRASYWIYY